MKYFVVKYSGPFGFIKPWTAVRDEEVFSQQFLTPSIVEGIEKKLFPELLSEIGIKRIVSHRLSYDQISMQKETTQAKGYNITKQKTTDKYIRYKADRSTSVINRGVLVNPVLYLAFSEYEYAKIALTQHICLCRNEDMIYPIELIETDKETFNSNAELFNGYELVFEKVEKSINVGVNRNTGEQMYGTIRIVGNPINVYKW